MRVQIPIYFLFTILGFFLGSTMFAYRIPKLLKNIDIRELSDDHNPGVANAYTYGGFAVGTLSLVCELGKGFLPVYTSRNFVSPDSLLYILVMLAPVIGHAYPFLRKEKGGKAIAVSFGVLMGLYPELRPLTYLIFFFLFFSLVVVISPHAIRTMIAFLLFAFSTALRIKIASIQIGCFLISVVVIRKHLVQSQKKPINVHLLLHHKQNQ